MIQAIGIQRYFREGSVQSATGPTGEKKAFDMNSLDRRIAVAPMMDWTDEVENSKQINGLRLPKNRRRLCVASVLQIGPGRRFP